MTNDELRQKIFKLLERIEFLMEGLPKDEPKKTPEK